MGPRDGWEPEYWERHRWSVRVTFAVLGILVALMVLVSRPPSLVLVAFAALSLVLAVLAVTALLLRYPGRAYGRPVATRVDDGTGPVDAVRFGTRRAVRWCAAGAFVVMAAVVFGILAYRARTHGLPLASGVLLGPGREGIAPGVPALFGYFLLLVAGVLVVVTVRVTRFVAVTPHALVLAYRTARARVPWDHIAEARPVGEPGIATPAGYLVERTIRRSIMLIPYAEAVPAPELAGLLRRFGGVRFLSPAAGYVPLISVAGLVAPSALLRAVRWHMARPHTPDALIDGYEARWRVEERL